jgi:hypothetical protein
MHNKVIKWTIDIFTTWISKRREIRILQVFKYFVFNYTIKTWPNERIGKNNHLEVRGIASVTFPFARGAGHVLLPRGAGHVLLPRGAGHVLLPRWAGTAVAGCAPVFLAKRLPQTFGDWSGFVFLAWSQFLFIRFGDFCQFLAKTIGVFLKKQSYDHIFFNN